MPKTNSERQKDFRDRQDKKAKAGMKLYKIFSAHAMDIAKILNPDERKAMNAIKEALKDA